jgi:hypothetical protein
MSYLPTLEMYYNYRVADNLALLYRLESVILSLEETIVFRKKAHGRNDKISKSRLWLTALMPSLFEITSKLATIYSMAISFIT